MISPNTTYIRSQRCKAIVQAVKEKDTPGQQFDYAASLAVIAHEGEHIDGVYNEARAQCYGVQRLAGELGNIGFSADKAALTALIAEDTWFTMPFEYKSTECRPGGELDLGVSDDYFDVPEFGIVTDRYPTS